MPECSAIDPLVTPYVDGTLPDAERQLVERHVGVCRPCRGRLQVERAVHDAIVAKRAALCSARASTGLRARCAALAREAGGTDTPHSIPPAAAAPSGVRPSWRTRLAPLAMAATLVLIVSAAFIYQLTASSTTVMAAELAADHVKCFALNGVLGTHDAAAAVESSMASGFDWRIRLPETGQAGLALVGSRPCLYGEGKVAHIMFRHDGTPVSLFMLPKSSHSEEIVRVLGHEAAIWSVGDRTFVLIARVTRDEVEHMAAYIQSTLR